MTFAIDTLSELIRAGLVPNITVPCVVTVMFENITVSSEISDVVVREYGRKFVPTFFAALCASLGAQLMTTTDYHHQPNCQMERDNRTLATRLCHFLTIGKTIGKSSSNRCSRHLTRKCVGRPIARCSVFFSAIARLFYRHW